MARIIRLNHIGLAVQDDARYGWGKRPYSWEFSVSAQHEIGRGVSVNGGVFRRWFGKAPGRYRRETAE